MSERTSELSKVLKGADFTWGEIVKLYQVGEYTIAEYHPWKENTNGLRFGVIDENALEYYAWVDGKQIYESFSTLDTALAGAIAYKYEGVNHRADVYFIQAIRR